MKLNHSLILLIGAVCYLKSPSFGSWIFVLLILSAHIFVTIAAFLICKDFRQIAKEKELLIK
jgi:hypothetical protein